MATGQQVTVIPHDLQQDARNLVTWLLLPGAQARIPDANTMAAWLMMLLTSCTPDASEQLEDEISAIRLIIAGAA